MPEQIIVLSAILGTTVQPLILVGHLFFMYLQIKKISLVPNKYGHDVKITMIGLYEDDGKWIKWVKLNEELVKVLSDVKIQLNK